MTDDFESLLEALVPGAARGDLYAADAPPFPDDLGLIPIDLLGSGGVGWVFRARDPVLDREVAVKISRPEGGAAARDAMLAEARTTAAIQHPCVLPVHRVVARNGLLVIEFALAPRTTLERRLADVRAHAVSWPRSQRLVPLLGVAGALERAHAMGAIHADLHPGNIALGASDEPWVLDWSGPPAGGTFTGRPRYAAPEQLYGAAPTAASDVFALGAMAWELSTLRPIRRIDGEDSVGAAIARWRDEVPPRLTEGEPALVELVARALATDPSDRPDAAAFRAALAEVLSGTAERSRRERDAEERVDAAHAALSSYRALVQRLGRERQVLAMHRSKVPGWAPARQKQPLWASEDRVASLADQQQRALHQAISLALQATTLAPSAERARELLAEAYWERLSDAEDRLDRPAAARAQERVRSFDDGRFSRILDGRARLELTCDADAATVHLSRWTERGRTLVAEPVHTEPLPLQTSLAPGSWLAEVRAEGRVPVRLNLRLGPLEERSERVELFAPEQVGPGWVQVPAGPFLMGGDPLARMSVERCEPWLDGFFIQRTTVTSDRWLAFLNALDVDEARQHVPGEMGFFGGSTAAWPHEGGAWRLPEGWPPDLPALGLNLADIERYAAWLSEREGRTVRLPTEEEWEKAARGVDGRWYPWGDHFDPSFAHMRRSRPGRPAPHPVGRYPVDCSPYGVLDMAGGLREWTGSIFDAGQMVIRGGTFGDDGDDLRCAGRSGFQPEFKFSFVGFRLVAEGPRP